MASLTLDNDTLVYRTPYDPHLVAALKVAIPATDRKWDPRRRVWLVASAHGQTLVALTAQYLGVQLSTQLSAFTTAGPKREARVLEVRYIGATKDRGDGDRSAFGWVQGEWSAIFPEPVLLSWFGDSPSNPDSPRDTGQATTTLYAVLAVKRSASGTDIRTAYRRMARQWHPDVCREPDAHERFIRIQRAYDVLKDPRLRARYDAGLQLEQAARVAEQQQRELYQPNWSAMIDGYRPPLRCGILLVEGVEQLGRFIVDNILAWEDVVDAQGRTLVTSWPMGAETFEERWV
jgi:hypothetical protein